MEAITRQKEVDEVKRIRKAIEGLSAAKAAGGVTAWAFLGNYQQVVHTGSGAYPAFYIQDTIDIAGVTMQDKALYPSNIELHGSPIYVVAGDISPFASPQSSNPLNYGVEWVMLTTVPFDVNAWVSGQPIANLPRRLPTIFGDSDPSNLKVLSAGDCLYGRVRYLQNDINTSSRVSPVHNEEFFGSLSPTMVDELYVTRIIAWFGLAPDSGTVDVIQIPELEFNIDAYIGEMSELSQIMELRRSYLTQQTIA